MMDTNYKAAVARVREFVTEHELWEGEDSHISTTGEYGTFERFTLNSGDLRAILNLLDLFNLPS